MPWVWRQLPGDFKRIHPMQPSLRIAIFLGASLLLAMGCATPKSVRALAGRTSANAASLSAQLGTFSAAHTRLADLRAQTLASRFAALERLRSQHEQRKAVLRIAGDTNTLGMFQALVAESDRAAQSAEELGAQESRMRADLKKALGPVVAPAKVLNEVAKRLEQVAAEETLLDRARALDRFYQDVRDQVDASLQDKDDLGKTAAKGSSQREEGIAKSLKALGERMGQ